MKLFTLIILVAAFLSSFGAMSSFSFELPYLLPPSITLFIAVAGLVAYSNNTKCKVKRVNGSQEITLTNKSFQAIKVTVDMWTDKEMKLPDIHTTSFHNPSPRIDYGNRYFNTWVNVVPGDKVKIIVRSRYGRDIDFDLGSKSNPRGLKISTKFGTIYRSLPAPKA